MKKTKFYNRKHKHGTTTLKPVSRNPNPSKITKMTKKISDKVKELTVSIKHKLHDQLFDDARKYIDIDKNFKDSSDIYVYLFNNDYNKENIGKWLLFNSPDYSIRNYAFTKLLKDEKINNEDKLKMYVDMVSNKSKYDFNMNNYANYITNINQLMNDEQICNKIDLFNIMYYSDFSNPNFFNHIKHYCNNIKAYDNTYQPILGNITADKITNLGIYTLYDQSPAFKHAIEVLSHLSELVPITLYIEATEINVKYDKYIKNKPNIKVELVGAKSDDELTTIIKNGNHIFLIFIYGFLKRRKVVLAHPAKYTFHYLDLPTLYSKHIYDYNIIDKYNYKHLQYINSNIDNDFSLLKLEIPFHMTPICNDCTIYRPEYNPEKLHIGLILNECKLCNKSIHIINKILSKNDKIYLTIYSFCDRTWLENNFEKYKARIYCKSYDNNNYILELQNNLLYIDTILCSGHSTTMEILASHRPIISFNNKNNYFGLITTNIIQHIDMQDELTANTEEHYVNLVLKHLKSKENYFKLYDKFIGNLEQSKILDNKYYASHLYNKLLNMHSEKINNGEIKYSNEEFGSIPKIMFITLTNNGYIDYTLNCLKSLESINSDISLNCYCIGKDSFNKLQEKGYKCILIDDEVNTNFQTFRTGNWSNITYKKFQIIYENLLKYEYVCFTDGDIVFQKPFFDYLLDNIGENDLLCQRDGDDIICSGFMFIKSNPNTIEIFNPLKMKDKEFNIGWDDQIYINEIKNQLKYKLLPLDLFPNGQYFYKNYNTINPYLIHFNWVVGHIKKQKMQEHNKWFITN